MKVLVDENLPPALARSLHALFEPEHAVIHIRERFGPGITDVEWIRGLSQEGRWAIISGDRRIARNRAERQAFHESKLIGFFLAPAIAKSPVTKQMIRILALWDNMVDLAGRIEGGALFELPGKSSRLRQIRI